MIVRLRSDEGNATCLVDPHLPTPAVRDWFVPEAVRDVAARPQRPPLGHAAHPVRRAAHRIVGWRCKWLFDILVSLSIPIVAIPVHIECPIAVRLGGPEIFLGQGTIGVDGRPITALKFRTLTSANENASDTIRNISQDVRLTPVGRFLRKTSLDELPQVSAFCGAT